MELAKLKDYEKELTTLIDAIGAERSPDNPYFPEVDELISKATEADRFESIELSVQAARLWLEKIREHKRMTTQ